MEIKWVSMIRLGRLKEKNGVKLEEMGGFGSVGVKVPS